MSTKKTIDIDIKNNARETQSDFDRLRKSIEESRKEVDKMSKAFGENSKEADRARQDLSDLTIAYDTLSQGATDLNATFEDVNDGMKPLTTRLGEAEDRLYELALAGDTTSREYQDLLKAVGQYRKVQLDTDMVVDSAATTMGQKLGGALGGATSGFAAVQGAMGLMGDESEALEKTLLKVQSALAIQQGFEGIRQAIPSFKQLGATASLAFKNMTTASKAFAVTGIGLLLTAVALAISKMDELKALFDDTTTAQKALKDTTEAYTTAQKDATVEVNKMAAAFDLAKKGVITKEEALEQYNETLGGALGAADNFNTAEEIFIKSSGAYVEAVALRAKANALFEKAAQIQADAIIEAMEVSQNRVSQGLSIAVPFGGLISAIGEATGATDDLNKAVNKLETADILGSADQQASEINKLAQETLAASERITAEFDINLRTTNRSTVKNAKTTAKELEDIQNEILRKRFEAIEDPHKRARLLRRLDLKEELEALKQRNISQEQFDEMSKFIQTEFREDMMAINAFYAKEEIVAMDVQAATEIETTKKTNEEIELQMAESAARQKAIDDKLAEDKKLNAMAVADAQLSIAHDSLGAIGQLATAFAKDDEKNAKKAFKINKAVGIAQAVVSTAQGIMSQLAVPQDALTGANFIKAGIVAATGAAQIATIAKTEFQGGGGADAPNLDEGGGEAQAPSFNVVGDSGINQIASLQQQPVQAFVVSGEVTTSQALDRNRVENATL
jgi:hypothetical protein